MNDLLTKAIATATSVISTSHSSQADTAGIVAESFRSGDFSAATEKLSSTVNALSAPKSGFKLYLEEEVGLNNKGLSTTEIEKRQARVDRGLQVAAAVMSLTESTSAWADVTKSNVKIPEGDKSIVVGNSGIVVESFTGTIAPEERAYSALVNALAAMEEDGTSVFLPTFIVPPTVGALSLKVSQPYIYSRTKRAADASVTELGKKNISRALEDRKILENETTKLVPVVTTQKSKYFVDEAVIATSTEMLDGVEVQTRPVKAGVSFDMIEIARRPGATAETDDRDTIDDNVGLANLLFKVDNSADANNVVSGGLALDVRGIPGSVFERPTANSSDGVRTLTLTATTEITNTTKLLDGTNLGLSGAGVLAAGFKLVYEVTVSGELNIETSSMKRVFGSVPTLVKAYDAQGKEISINDTEVAKLDAALALTMAGYTYDSYAYNSSVRNRGLYVDSSRSVNYVYKMRVHAPFSTQSPIDGDGGAASLEMLNEVIAAQATNRRVEAILEAKHRIKALFDRKVKAGDAAAQSFAGSQHIDPYFNEVKITLADEITTRRSGEKFEDLSRLIIDAIIAEVGYGAKVSGYNSAIRGGDYEIAVLTESRIAPLIMRSGDERTFGEHARFNIGSVDDSDLTDTILVTLNRVNRTGDLDPLTFGGYGLRPNIVRNVTPRSESNGVSNETVAQPVDSIVTTLPFMIEIKLEGLSAFYRRGN